MPSFPASAYTFLTSMRITATIVFAALLAGLAFSPQSPSLEPTYVGSSSCAQGCHTGRVDDFSAWTDLPKSGHSFILNPVSGSAPTYPANTSPGVTPPAGTSWSDFSHVIGGYGTKALFVKTDGTIYTAGDDAQLNIADGSRVPFHQGEVLNYDFSCFKCHTTGPREDDGGANSPGAGLGSFNEAGVRCEACHGPGSDHLAQVFVNGTLPPNQGETLQLTVCQNCHNQGTVSNTVLASDGFIVSEGQANELLASAHGDGNAPDLTCATCHNPHVPLQYPEAASAGLSGIRTACQNCHADKQVLLDGVDKGVACTSCHMPKATKSALGGAVGNGWMGDRRTHLFAINSSAVTREAMFSPDGSTVALDGEGHGSVTLDFSCLGCHTDKTVTWAANYAPVLHTSGIHTASEAADDVPTAYALQQNYPNPFNPSTTVEFSLPKTASVTLKVFDVSGRLMGTVLDQRMPAGNHTVSLDASGLTTGVYLYELRTGDFAATRTMVVSK